MPSEPGAAAVEDAEVVGADTAVVGILEAVMQRIADATSDFVEIFYDFQAVE